MDRDFIYALKYDGKYVYIGSTNNTARRFAEHKKKMSEHKHSAKILNGKQDEVEIIPLCNFEQNSFTRVIIEGCYNSIYAPKNGNIIQQGLSKISVQRIERNVAIAILNAFVACGVMEYLDEINMENVKVDIKKTLGRKSKI